MHLPLRLALPLGAGCALAAALAPAAPAQPLFDAPWVAYNAGDTGTGRYVRNLAVADVTGDGRPDALLARSGWNSGFVLLPNDGAGAFGAPSFFASGTPSSHDVVAGDFDGDGRADVVVSNTNQGLDGSTVTLFRNTGGGTFAAPVSFPAGSAPTELAAADVDGDGRLDLAVSLGHSASTSVAVLRNTGGAFAAPVQVGVGGRPGAIAAGDLTGDGRPDLVVTHYVYGGPVKVSVLANDGAGGFATLGTYTEPRMGWDALALADLDRDGDLDVVTEIREDGPPNSGLEFSTFLLYENTGGGALAPDRRVQKTAFTGTSPDLAVADLNGDAWPDLVGLELSGRSGDGPQVALSNGAGGFHPVTRYAGGQYPHAVDAADVDGDGDLDLLAVDKESFALNVYENPGDGRFPRTPTWDLDAWNLHLDLGDVDADGDLDVLTTAGASTAQYGGNGRVSINDGSGTFATVRPVARPGGIAHGKLRDMDGDGDLDVLANAPDTNPPYDFFTALNDGAGQFGPLTRHVTNSCGWGHVDAFDFDGDGDLDVANLEESGCIGGGGGALYLSRNRGNATFDPPILLDLTVGIFEMAGGDLDGDGHVDLAIANRNADYVFVLLGNGDFTFDPATYAVGTRPYGIEAADFDRDGDLDLATTHVGADPGGQFVAVAFNDGAGRYGPPVTYGAPTSYDLAGTTGLAAGDVDGDGDVDLLRSGVSGDAAAYLNDGTGAFSYTHRYGVGYWPEDVHVADVTGDGRADLLAIVDRPPPYPETHLGVVSGAAVLLTGGEPGAPAPGEGLALSAAAPNPVRGRAAVTLTLDHAETVTVAVYDALGRRVATLHEGPLAAGAHPLVLEAAALAPGLYVVRAAGDGVAVTRRVVVVR